MESPHENEPVSVTKSDLPPATDDAAPESYPDIPTTGGAPTGRAMRRLLLKIAIPVVLVVVIIIAAVAGRKGSSSTAASEQSDPYAGDSVYLPPPPDDLANICSSDSIETEAGRTACELECTVAGCCDFPTNLPMSCLESNRDRCITYHSYCVALNMINPSMTTDTADTSLPSAPAGINTYCSPVGLSTPDGMEACYNACKPAECCYETDVTSCATDPTCDQYKSCFYLGASDHVDDDIPTIINQKCSDTNLMTEEGRQGCATACEQALCCFDGPEDVCPQVDGQDLDEFCRQYGKCADLLRFQDMADQLATGEIGESATSGEDSYNSDGSENQDSSLGLENQVDFYCLRIDDEVSAYNKCQALCYDALCCFDSTKECSTAIDCDKYESCRILMGDLPADDTQPDNSTGSQNDENPYEDIDQTNGELKAELENYCSDLEYDTSKQLCQEMCDNARCCFATESSQSCPNGQSDTTIMEDGSSITVTCTIYEICSNLSFSDQAGGSDNSDTDSSLKDEVANYCNEIDFDPSFRRCAELCADSWCCFDGDGCTDSNPNINCDNYQACQNLLLDGSP